MEVTKTELAKTLAVFAHNGQKDKAGRDYANHPLAVAKSVQGENEQTVAFLHDILEDTFVTEDTLRNLFGDEITDAVVSMTRKEGEGYEDYIKRVGENPISRRVKLADLKHNMDLSRLPVVTDADRKRVQKYKKAESYLRSL